MNAGPKARKSGWAIFGKITACLIATLLWLPVIMLGTATAVDRLGITGVSIELFDEMVRVALKDYNEFPATPVGLGILGGVLGSIGLFVLLWFLSRRSRVDLWPVAISLALVAGVYGWMAWDEPLQPGPQGEELFRNGTVTPLELARECTRDAMWGRLASWPVGTFESQENPKPEWLAPRTAVLKQGWEDLAPIRDWAERINRYDHYDDYVFEVVDPTLRLEPLKQLQRGAEQTAALLASEGDHDAARNRLQLLYSLGSRIRVGSRNQVGFLIGLVLERSALRSWQTLANRYPEAHQIYAQFDLDTEDFKPRQDLRRAMIGDSRAVVKAMGWKPTQSALDRFVFLFVLNHNRTINEHFSRVEFIVTSIENGDAAKAEEMEEYAKQLAMRVHFNNPYGHFLLGKLMPPGVKRLTNFVEEREKLQREALATMTALRDETARP